MSGGGECPLGEAPFGLNTSPVSWCEHAHTHSQVIAEWYNTWSNGAFLLAAAWMLRSFRCAPPRFGMVVALVAAQGATSAWFHGSRSIAGQMGDELCIVYTVGMSLGVFARRLRLALLASAAYTVLMFVAPRWNHRVLACTAPVIVAGCDLLVGSLCAERAWRVWRRSLRWVALSFGVWVLDMALCRPFLVNLQFHALWHVLISLALVHLSAAGCAAHDPRCRVRYVASVLPATSRER